VSESRGMTWARVPGSIRLHLLITVCLALVRLKGYFSRYQPMMPPDRRAQLEWGLIGSIVVCVGLAALYSLMLNGIDWARLVLGVVTFPLGLILLLAPSARQYTGDQSSYEPEEHPLRSGDEES